jgi:tol-pal system protein YbgF
MNFIRSLLRPINIIILFNFLLIVVFTGCSGSEETSKNSKESTALTNVKELDYRTKINQLTSNVDSLKQINLKLNEDFQKSRQDNSNLNIRLSETEKDLNDLKSKIPDNSNNELRRKEYSDALLLFETKKYSEAIAKFQKIFSDDPSGDFAPNCVYWVGESFNGLKEIPQAIKSFEQVLSAYPNSSKTDAAMLMLGNCYLKLKDKKQAKEIFENLQQQYPKSYYNSKVPKEFKLKAETKEK